jgi:hypothetical protein
MQLPITAIAAVLVVLQLHICKFDLIIVFFFFFSFPSVELRNDHRELTEKINQNIQVLHSARLPSGSSPPNESGNCMK